jgi:hypothetical protein
VVALLQLPDDVVSPGVIVGHLLVHHKAAASQPQGSSTRPAPQDHHNQPPAPIFTLIFTQQQTHWNNFRRQTLA